MFINKLNQLYKPKRILFYTEATDEEIREFYEDKVPERVNRYSGAFGTYDYPGVFFVSSLEREVIGIEYREGDNRIEYPTDLKSITLDGSFFYSVEIDSKIDMSWFGKSIKMIIPMTIIVPAQISAVLMHW